MRLLLVNKNPVVSRMMNMSVPKAGFEMEECDNVYDLPSGKYEVVVIDDDMYDENFLHDIKQHIQYKQIGLITAARTDLADKFDFILSKPFLPTDLIEVLRGVKSKITESAEENEYEKEPLEEFIGQKLDEALGKDFAQETPPLHEKIVEVQESVEESPFVEKIEEPGDVLDKSELEKVSELLEETEEDNDFADILNATKEREPISLIDDERTADIERTPEPISLLDEEEEPAPAATATESVEREKEEILEMLQQPFEEESLQPSAGGTHAAPQEAPQPQTEALATESPVDEITEPSVAPQSPAAAQVGEHTASHTLDVADVAKNLSIDDIRKILDGMKLEISIKITYPKSDDV